MGSAFHEAGGLKENVTKIVGQGTRQCLFQKMVEGGALGHSLEHQPRPVIRSAAVGQKDRKRTSSNPHRRPRGRAFGSPLEGRQLALKTAYV